MKKIILILLLFVAGDTFAQTYSRPQPALFGLAYLRVKSDSFQHVPRLSSLVIDRDTTPYVIVFQDSTWFRINGVWTNLMRGASRSDYDSAYARRVLSFGFNTSNGTLTAILGSGQRLDIGLDGRYNKIGDTSSMLSGYARSGNVVPNTRTLTINGTSYDLSADRSWTVAAGVTSVFGRTGAVTALIGDYSSFYLPIASPAFTGTLTGPTITTTSFITSGLIRLDPAGDLEWYNGTTWQNVITFTGTNTAVFPVALKTLAGTVDLSDNATTPSTLRLSNLSGSGEGARMEWFSGFGSKVVAKIWSSANGSNGSLFKLQLLDQTSAVLTDRISIDNFGAVTFSSSITADKGTFTTTTGEFLTSASATTGQINIGIRNTSGSAYVGIASSAGSFFTGSTNYSMNVGTASNQSLHLATNNIVRLTIDGSGSTIITGDVFIGGPTGQFQIYPNFSAGLNLIQNYNNNSAVYTTEEHRADSYIWKIGTTLALYISSAGSVGIGGASGGPRLDVYAGTGIFAGSFTNNGSTGNNYGVAISAGTNGSDYSLLVRNSSFSNLFSVLGNGVSTFTTASGANARFTDGTTTLFTYAGSGAAGVGSDATLQNGIIFTPSSNSVQINTAGLFGLLVDGNRNFEFNYHKILSNNTTYRNMSMGGAGFLYANGVDAYISSNMFYNSANNWEAKYTSSVGMGHIQLNGGQLAWFANNGSVTAGTTYAVTNVFSVSGAGLISAADTIEAKNGAALKVWDASNVDRWTVKMGAGGQLAFSFSGNQKFTMTSTGSFIATSQISAGAPIILPTYLVSTLPTCNAGMKAAVAYVTDALTPSFLVVVVGGGTTGTEVSCNGTNWVGQ